VDRLAETAKTLIFCDHNSSTMTPPYTNKATISVTDAQNIIEYKHEALALKH